MVNKASEMQQANDKINQAIWLLENAAVKSDARTAKEISDLCEGLSQIAQECMNVAFYIELRGRQ